MSEEEKKFKFHTVLGRGCFKSLVKVSESKYVAGGSNSLHLINVDYDLEIASQSRLDTQNSINCMLKDTKDDNFIHFGGMNYEKSPIIGKWDLENKVFCCTKVEVEQVSGLDLHPKASNDMIVCSSDGLLLRFDMRQSQFRRVALLRTPLHDVKYSPYSEHMVAFGTENNNFYVYDLRNARGPLIDHPGHSKEIFSVDWHPTNKNILATSSLDKSIKIWDLSQGDTKNIEELKNQEGLYRMKWVNGLIHNQDRGLKSRLESPCTRLASSSQVNDKNLTIWDISKSSDPSCLFKNKNKELVVDFQFRSDEKAALYLSQEGYFSVHSFTRSTEVMGERRSNILACDIMDGYAWGVNSSSLSDSCPTQNNSDAGSHISSIKAKTNKQMFYMCLSRFKSCYEEVEIEVEDEKEDNTVPDLGSLHKEFYYFIQNYMADQSQPLTSLQFNKQVALKAGKVEISGIWESLHDLLSSNLISQKNSGTNKEIKSPKRSINSSHMRYAKQEQNFRSVLNFYTQNEDRFMYDIQSGRISISEDKLCVRNDYEPVLYDMIDEFNIRKHQRTCNLFFSKERMASTLESILQEIIDNGEFMHAYKMYQVVESAMVLAPSKKKIWEYTYIDLLRTMSFNNRSAYAVKMSPIEEIRQLSKDDTQVWDNCANCRKRLKPSKNGICHNCKKPSAYCVVCNMPVKGLMIWCQICSHGGHLHELKEWFSKKGNTCPSGCGHRCFNFD